MDSATELRLMNLLSQMADYKASDLHISVGSVPALRIAGQIAVLNNEPVVTVEFVESLLANLLTPEQRIQLDQKKQLVFALNIKSKARYKLHAFYQAGFPTVTLRALPTQIRPLSALTLPQQAQQLVGIESGLVLVTGHFGSGKSTFIWGWIEQLNQTAHKHIVTIEHPVEVQFNDLESIIEQRELGVDISTVEDITQFVAQEDIDVINLSLPVTVESVDTAIQLARMGKLVLFEAPFDSIQAALGGMIELYPHDRRDVTQQALAETLVAAVGAQSVPQLAGGTIMATEIARTSEPLRSVIAQGAFDQLDMVMTNGQADGMRTMQESLADLRMQGIIQ